jgi:hypothetical protein
MSVISTIVFESAYVMLWTSCFVYRSNWALEDTLLPLSLLLLGNSALVNDCRLKLLLNFLCGVSVWRFRDGETD